MQRLVIDRFENGLAVCETENMSFINIPMKLLPKNAKEGDVLIKDSGNIRISEEETKNDKDRIKAKMDRLFKK